MILASELMAWLDTKPWKGAAMRQVTPCTHRMAEAGLAWPASWQWLKLVSMPVFLMTLTVAPLMLVQPKPSTGSAVSTVSVDSATLDQPAKSNEVDEPFEFGDGV